VLEFELAFGGLVDHQEVRAGYRSHRTQRNPETRIHRNLLIPLVQRPQTAIILLRLRHFFWRLCLLVFGIVLLPLFVVLVALYFVVGFPALWLFRLVTLGCSSDSCSQSFQDYRTHFFALICMPTSMLALALSEDIV
ncbi:MAG: hypothetical protein Q8P67_24705, partial [archaeon]|nr:hypothetical protein [archaeon]